LNWTRGRRLRAALAAVLVNAAKPELKLVHELLDNWSGIGLIVGGMAHQGWDVQLTAYAARDWLANFFPVGIAHSIVGGLGVGADAVASGAGGGVGDTESLTRGSDEHARAHRRGRMYQSASRVPEAARQSRPRCPEAADLSRRRSVLVDSPPRPLAAKRPEEPMSIALSIVESAAWVGACRRGAVPQAAWRALRCE
jgi:hypothetical protein